VVLGGAWVWGDSSHPPVGPVSVDVVDGHPVTEGLPTTFEIVDEVYGDLFVEPGVHVLATARRSPDDDDQPIAWAHGVGAGRVVYCGLGHDVASLEVPAHARLLRNAVRWVAYEPIGVIS
jgi:type 1 glutamine amidotransferase